MEIVKLSSENVSQTEQSRRFSCSQSTISKILSRKDALIQEAAENSVGDRKRKCTDAVKKAADSVY